MKGMAEMTPSVQAGAAQELAGAPWPAAEHPTLAQRWRAGGTTWGAWSVLADAGAAELLGRSGADYVCVDLQHGHAGLGTVVPVLQALRHTPASLVVRVAAGTDEQIMRVLDLGAECVVVPMVESAAQAAAALRAAAYPPEGSRSWGPMWADVDGAAPDPAAANARVSVAVMIETAAGLANADEICAVPGLDAVYVGPNDLALSCGWGRSDYRSSGAVNDAIETVLAATARHGIAMGLHCADPQMAAHWAGKGVRMVTVATDATSLRRVIVQELAEARAAGGAGREALR